MKALLRILDSYGPLGLGVTLFILVAYLYQPLMLHVEQREIEQVQLQQAADDAQVQKSVAEIEALMAQYRE